MDINIIKRIAIEAGKKIISVYDSNCFEVELKPDESPLTLADRISNQHIVTSLQKEFPDIPIISEETKHTPYEERKNWHKFWLVDPLDGTKEFIKKNGEFTVNIALIENNRPILGVVYIPVSEQIFWACKGQGSYLGQGADITKINTSSFRSADDNLVIVCSKSHIDDATEKFISNFTNYQKHSVGSSLKFLLLAQGKAHLYPRFAPTMEWDIAAADIILFEAKGKIIDQSTKKLMQYNKESLRNPSFVAYGDFLE